MNPSDWPASQATNSSLPGPRRTARHCSIPRCSVIQGSVPAINCAHHSNMDSCAGVIVRDCGLCSGLMVVNFEAYTA